MTTNEPTNDKLARSNTSLSTPSTGLAFKDQVELFTAIAKANNSGINTPEEGILLYNKARALNIDWAIAMGNMTAINGKIGLNIHLIKGILSVPSNNVTWEFVSDYAPIYQYITSTNDRITDKDFDPMMHVLVPLVDVMKPRTDGLIAITYNISKSKKVIVDRVTRIKFTRTMPNGTTKTQYGEFSYSEAITAGLGVNKQGELDSYSPWTKYPKLMIEHRAFTFGARAIASDLLNGCQEITELYDINNIAYDASDEGTITVLDANGNAITNA